MRVTRFAAAVLLSGCASGAKPPMSRPPVPSGDGIVFPKQVTDFRLVRVQRFENPGEGEMLRFVAPDRLIADVYLYPPPNKWGNCEKACADSAVDQEEADFIRLVPALVQRGYHLSARVTEEKNLSPPADAKWLAGRYVQLAITDKAGEGQSEYYVFYIPHVYVKVRSDFLLDYSRRQRVREFSEKFVDMLQYTHTPVTQSASATFGDRPAGG